MTILQPQTKVKNYDITKEDAEELLKPYFPILQGIVNQAWEDWEALPNEHRAKLDSRARANCVNSFMVHHARAAFDDKNNIKITDSRGLFLLEFHDELNIRLKKLTNKKKTCNVATKQQIRFQFQLDLPGMPKVVRLTLGYVLDPTQTKINDILVVYNQGNKLAWDISIFNAKSSVVQIPLPNIQNSQRSVKIRAKANKLKQSKD